MPRTPTKKKTAKKRKSELVKGNPSDAHWATMNPDFQRGLIKESAQEWADYLNANRKKGEGKWSISSATSEDGTISWFVTEGRKNPYADTPKRYLTVKHMLKRINKLKKSEIGPLMERHEIPLSARESLMVFVKRWSDDDRDHTVFLKQIPAGVDQLEALRMGDLLYYLITGANEKSSLAGAGDAGSARWDEYLTLKLPRGLTVHDLTGLHVELLNYIPQRAYNTYTLNQMFLEDPALYSQLFENHTPLTPMEHDALQTLSQIVQKGNIEKFKLTMMYGSEEDWERFASYSSPGATMLEAFDTAKMASAAYAIGDYETARNQLDELQTKYEIPIDAFQMGMRDMFIVTPSTAALGVKTGGGGKGKQKGPTLYVKGEPIPLLVSLDLSMPPNKRKGWKGPGVAKAIRITANGPAPAYTDKGKIDTKKDAGGLASFRPFGTGKPLQTTDWTTIFQTALEGKAYTQDNDDGWTKISWPKAESLTLRFIIHANLAEGITDLLPKGILTVVARSYEKDGAVAMGDWHFKMVKSGSDTFFTPQIDIFLEDAGGLKDLEDAFMTSKTKQKRDVEEIKEGQVDFDAIIGAVDVASRGGVRRNPPRGARGGAYAIDLTPKSQIAMNSLKENSARYLKPILKGITGGKEMYDFYARGNTFKDNRRLKSGPYKGMLSWKPRGKPTRYYNTKTEAWADLQAIGSHVDRGGFPLRMLFARRRDNNAYVPTRIIIPKIAVTHDKRTGRIVAKKGSKHYSAIKALLKRLEDDFGDITFVKDLPDTGAWNLPGPQGEQKTHPRKSSKTKPKLLYNRGVAKIFESKGLTYRGERAFVDHIQPGEVIAFTYSARMPGGKMKQFTKGVQS